MRENWREDHRTDFLSVSPAQASYHRRVTLPPSRANRPSQRAVRLDAVEDTSVPAAPRTATTEATIAGISASRTPSLRTRISSTASGEQMQPVESPTPKGSCRASRHAVGHRSDASRGCVDGGAASSWALRDGEKSRPRGDSTTPSTASAAVVSASLRASSAAAAATLVVCATAAHAPMHASSMLETAVARRPNVMAMAASQRRPGSVGGGGGRREEGGGGGA